MVPRRDDAHAYLPRRSWSRALPCRPRYPTAPSPFTRRLAARRLRAIATLTAWFPYIAVLLLLFGRHRYGWDDNSISGGPDAQRE